MPARFFIVGAAKCGTTSLDNYLGQHPDLFIAAQKECNFFSIPEMPKQFQGSGDDVFQSNLISSSSEYERMFADALPGQLCGESSVAYLYYPGVAQRIHEMCPDAKIIIMLRNPIRRAYSAYLHLVRDGRETLNFMDGLKEEPNRQKKDYQPLWMYRETGMYCDKVKRYIETFGRDNVHVLMFEDFSRNAAGAVKEVFQFLGVPTNVEINTASRYNLTGTPKGAWYRRATASNWLTAIAKPLLPPSIRRKLRLKAISMSLARTPMPADADEFLRPLFEQDIDNLEALLERDLSHWRR